MLDATSLNILTTEGMMRITFRPVLCSAQYTELLETVRREELRTRQQIKDVLSKQACDWGVSFEAEDLSRW